jgi:hypothetical protein
MTGDDGTDERPNVRWETDFGPATPLWKRYLLAAVLIALVAGFLAAAIFLLGDRPGARTAAEPWLLPALIGLAVVFTVVSVFGERWAIRIRTFFGGRADPPDE